MLDTGSDNKNRPYWVSGWWPFVLAIMALVLREKWHLGGPPLSRPDRIPMDELEEEKKWELDVRTAYQVAANLYMQENTVTWARFNTIVATNTIIMAAIGIVAQHSHELFLFALILPIAGCLLCLVWLNIMKRGFAYHNVWRDSAYALEKQFSPRVQTLHYADQLRRNGTIRIKISENDPRDHHTPKPNILARDYAEFVIYLFFFIYLVAFVQICILLFKDQST
jgi:hypothetical protein